MGEKEKNDNSYVLQQDNTQVRRPVLQQRFQKATPTQQIQSYIKVFGVPQQSQLSQSLSPEEKEIARGRYQEEQAKQRLYQKGQILRNGVGFIPIFGDAADMGISTLEVASGKESPSLLWQSAIGLVPFMDFFTKGKKIAKGVNNIMDTFNEASTLRNINRVKDNPSLIIDNYYKRTGFMPSELIDDSTILRDGMNVKQLYIDEQIKIIQKNNPGMSYEQAKYQLDKDLAKEGISIRDIEDADGLNVSFELPENQQFNGTYAAKIHSPYRRNMVQVHEDGHLTRNHNTELSKETRDYNADGFRQPQNEREKYIHDQEKSAYGTEILGILGKDKYDLTGEELKYLHDNAMRLGLSGEMIRMLNMVTDFNQAAKWINSHSNIITGAAITGIGVPSIIGINNNE